MNLEHLTPVTGTITDMADYGNDCCSRLITLAVEGQTIQFVMTQDTFVVDSVRLMPGTRIAAFYDISQPVPLIYPPRYRAVLITALLPETNVSLAYFDDSLTAADASLKLNLYPSALISTLNGQAFTCSPANHFLLVYYSAVTRSIPPQTSPSRIIALCRDEI